VSHAVRDAPTRGGETVARDGHFWYHEKPAPLRRIVVARTSIYFHNAVIMRFILRTPASLRRRADSALTQSIGCPRYEEAV